MAKQDEKSQINFNFNPEKTPVMLVDGYLIGSNENYVTFSFAQGFMDGKQQHVVSRVGMTPKQAREFLEKLNDHIQKFEV